MLKINLVGISGYTGLELLRLIDQHPNTQIKALFANRSAGQKVSDIYPQLSAKDFPIIESFNPDEISPGYRRDISYCAFPSRLLFAYSVDLGR